METKKGQLRKHLGALILVGIFVGIGFWWIFFEYSSQDDLSWEVCRQSVLVRGAAPSINLGAAEVASFKDDFPLKCKTSAITITEDMLRTGEGFPSITGAAVTPTGEETEIQANPLGVQKAEQLIARTIAECWGLFGQGDQNLFPAKVFGIKSYCVPCARIHLTQNARDYLKETGQSISIEQGLRRGGKDSFLEFLQNSGDQFPAFGFGGAVDFKLDNEEGGFRCACGDERHTKNAVIRNRLTGKTTDDYDVGSLWLPKHMNPDWGDLLIMYGTTTFSDNDNIGAHLPYLFYFQTEEPPYKKIDKTDVYAYHPWHETDDEYLDGPIKFGGALCEIFEGIPG